MDYREAMIEFTEEWNTLVRQMLHKAYRAGYGKAMEDIGNSKPVTAPSTDTPTSANLSTMTLAEQGHAFMHLLKTTTYKDWMKQTGRFLPTTPKGLTLDTLVNERDLAIMLGVKPAYIHQACLMALGHDYNGR